MPGFVHNLSVGGRRWLRRGRQAERFQAFLFYLGYFKWPALLLGATLVISLAIYDGLLPLGNYLSKEKDYYEAERHYRAGDNSRALVLIRHALLHDRDDVKLWKLAGNVSDALGLTEAAYCWQQVDKLEPGHFDTEMQIVEAALHSRQLDVASRILERIRPQAESSLRFDLAAGKLAEMGGESDPAQFYYRLAEAHHANDSATRLALAEWHLNSSNAADLDPVRRDLGALLRDAPFKSAALRLLIDLEIKRGRFQEAENWCQQLLRQPNGFFSDQIRQLDVLVALREEGPLRQVLQNLRATVSRENMGILVAWMTAHERAEQALIWIREMPEEAQDDPLVGVARAECLVALGLWEHLRDIQAADDWAEQDHERLMYLAAACFQLGDEQGGRAAWQQAALACRQYDDFVRLLHFADRLAAQGMRPNDWAEQRANVWSQLILHYPDQGWALQALYRDALQRKDLLQAKNLAGWLHKIEPRNPAWEADYDWLCLLRGDDPERASLSLHSLLPAYAAVPSVAFPAAYDFYRRGDFGQALGLIGALPAAEAALPSHAVYVGAFLAVNQPIDQARLRLEQALADPELLEEEKVLANRSLALLDYRVAMAAFLKADPRIMEQGPDLFDPGIAASVQPALFRVGRAVAQSRGGHRLEAEESLGKIDPAQLDAAGLSIYCGGLLELAGQSREAERWLELSSDLPVEDIPARLHRCLALWWQLRGRQPGDLGLVPGLFATYRALDVEEKDPLFWQRDAPQELILVRDTLLHRSCIDEAQDRLNALAQYVSFTPQMEAQFAYSLLLQGRSEAARARMETLAPEDRLTPEGSLYYGLILAACGNKKEAQPWLNLALRHGLTPDQRALATTTGASR